MKVRSPVLGFNHNVRHRGRLFHVQTEDSGVQNPHIFTHLFHGGTIIHTKKVDYDRSLGEMDVKGLMQAQHKMILRELKKGSHDAKIVQYLGPHPEAAGAEAAEPAEPAAAAAPVVAEATPPPAAQPAPAAAVLAAPATASSSGAIEELSDDAVIELIPEDATERMELPPPMPPPAPGTPPKSAGVSHGQRASAPTMPASPPLPGISRSGAPATPTAGQSARPASVPASAARPGEPTPPVAPPHPAHPAGSAVPPAAVRTTMPRLQSAPPPQSSVYLARPGQREEPFARGRSAEIPAVTPPRGAGVPGQRPPTGPVVPLTTPAKRPPAQTPGILPRPSGPPTPGQSTRAREPMTPGGTPAAPPRNMVASGAPLGNQMPPSPQKPQTQQGPAARGNVVARPPVMIAGQSSGAVRRPTGTTGAAPAPARETKPGGDPPGIFGQGLISERSLDEVILAYLSEDTPEE